MALDVPVGKLDETTVRRLWWAALDTLQDEILSKIDVKGGIWLASPLPALYEPKLLESMKGWVWSPEGLETSRFTNIGLLPPTRSRSFNNQALKDSSSFKRLPLRLEDGNDPLLIIITSEVQVLLALQGQSGERNLLMRNDKDTVQDVLKMISLRLEEEDFPESLDLRKALQSIRPIDISNDLDRVFWPLVSEKLAGFAPSLNIQTLPDRSNLENISNINQGQISLLEAITHEVRTPLATIRTLVRSLLRRNDITNEVLTRLKQIDSECNEQIDRFGLIFKAAELERNQSSHAGLARTDLGNMIEIMYPVWSKQLERRGLELKLEIAPDLPQVLSDSEQLELMLGGLIDRNSRGLKSGGSLILELSPAGHRLKLQIICKSANIQLKGMDKNQTNADLGPVVSWNPSTGSLQLSQAATQRLLASLGGIATDRREKGLTVFFPVAN